MIEAARHVAGEFDMRQLVGPDRHQSGAVQQNVRRLQQWIAKKAVGVEVLVLQVLLQFLYDGTRSSQPNGQIIDSKRCSSACSGTCD